jgi:hypothetical protein
MGEGMSDDREIQLEAEKHGVFLTTMQRFYNWATIERNGRAASIVTRELIYATRRLGDAS